MLHKCFVFAGRYIRWIAWMLPRHMYVIIQREIYVVLDVGPTENQQRLESVGSNDKHFARPSLIELHCFLNMSTW